MTVLTRRARPPMRVPPQACSCAPRRAASKTIPAPVPGDEDVREWFASRVLPDLELWLA